VIQFPILVAGAVVGLAVGFTGMGGGALMTPLLVLGFGVQPLAAVSSDLVASVVMKPIGGAVHLKRGTVHRGLVRWLVLGSVPSAFAGVLLLRSLASGAALQHLVRLLLGAALLMVAVALVVRRLVRRAESEAALDTLQVRPLPTLAIGVVGGLTVGMTSVGSGSLMMLLLLLLYPRISLRQLVGTDLVQAVPLVAAAALAHVLFGDFRWAISLSILIGAVPGVYVGARISTRAPDKWIRLALVAVLLLAGMKLIGADRLALAWIAGG
jgi:uncharacterized protein